MNPSLIIIGSTGSVGSSAVSVIKHCPQLIPTELLVAHSNYRILVQQAVLTNAKYIALLDELSYAQLQQTCQELNCQSKILTAKEILPFILKSSARVLLASNGVEALNYLLPCIKANKVILLANKEALVCAGELIKHNLAQSSAHIIPVDSEHNALYQILLTLEPQALQDVAELILTASGGPFYHVAEHELQHITPQQAVNHPNWSMGKVISVNSATLVNKALEVAEAYYLFNLKNPETVKVVYHPQSLIHGGVNYTDGSLITVAYKPTMEVSLAYALKPAAQRLRLDHLRCSLTDLNQITLEPLHARAAEPINMVRELLEVGKDRMCVFNVANEAAVSAFLLGKIKFSSIIKVIKHCLDTVGLESCWSEEEVLPKVEQVQQVANSYILSLSS